MGPWRISAVQYVFCGLCFWVIFPAMASDYYSPRSAALGGSGHAGPLLNDSIFLNPSFSSFLPAYSIGMNYLSFNAVSASPDKDANQGKNYSFSIQDGRSEFFQAGAAYSKRMDGTFFHIGASKSFVNRMGFGLGGKFFFENENKDYRGGRDATASVTVVPANWFQAALVADNLFQTEEGLARGLKRELILGLKFNVDGIVLVYTDPHYTPTPSPSSGERLGVEAGLEFILASDFFLRFGYFKNASIPFQAGTRGRGFGAGFGWMAPRLSLDYGLSRALSPTAATAHTVGATAYF